MKNLKQIIRCTALLLATTFFVFSCKSDDDGGTNNSGGAAAGTLQAKVSGAADFQASGALATAMYVATGKTLTIYATDLTGRGIQIILNNYDGTTGTWEIPNGVGSIGVIATYTEGTSSGTGTSWVAPYAGSGKVGELKISEFSSTGSVKGTFNFKGRDQNNTSSFKDITNGSFNIGVKSY